LIGADVSRTGVQRALLKPMEETEVELKVPHDPISMIQEIEQFRKTGKREKRTVNTKNILFIMSGAFFDLPKIIKKRVSDQAIGFGAHITTALDQSDMFKHVMSEDLIGFGFETEFVGRLPVRAIFERLTEDDLFEIMKNPNNPIVLGKKLDFAAYDIDVKFDDKALRILTQRAFEENTGARGLVSAVESALLQFEKKLPSTDIKKFPVTADVIEDPNGSLQQLISPTNEEQLIKNFDRLAQEEKEFIKEYIKSNRIDLVEKYSLTLSASRINVVAAFYGKHVMTIETAIKKIKAYYDEIKSIELHFFRSYDMNIVLEEDAIDFIIEEIVNKMMKVEEFYKQLTSYFEHGLELVREKTGRNRFFITREALVDPETFISNLIKNEIEMS
ncbi:MAG: AAA family ATPase, partial [Deltaproteobacteria bacterium]|nr:AAA family ATPase [Deltaproteobacteria bacterium]